MKRNLSVKQNQRGFAVLEVLLIVVVIAVIGVVGYKLYNARKTSSKTTSAPTQSSKAATISGVPASIESIKTKADLTTAAKAVDDTDPDASSTDLSALETQLGTF